jgi:hypothetical protein
MNVVPEKDWETYCYQSKDEIVLVTFHASADKIVQKEFPYCARVLIPIHESNAFGGVERPEAEVLWAMEDRLVEALQAHKVACLLLGRLTHGGLRELVFQVADWETFRPAVGKWMIQYPDYQTDVSEHDGWEFFFECLWPSPTGWLFIADRRVVDNLVRSGSEPSKPHLLQFVFHGAAAGLESLRERLLQRAYTVRDFKPTDQTLVMALSLPLEVNRIFEESSAHTKAAEELGLEYAGWGCLIVP